MIEKTDDDIFVACCDECFDEIDFRGRWNDFRGFIKSEGWLYLFCSFFNISISFLQKISKILQKKC